ncbi:MAG: hypothetical protein ACI88G_002402 [Woeseiaceae bacterium]|jgi:hypothetical protein
MSDFEFISVFVAIVIGFGATHLLGGLGRAYHFRRVNKMDAVHVAWTIAVFFVLVLNWWVFMLWRDIDEWTFSLFFTVIMWTTSMYVLALALYPPNLPEDVNYREMFESNRTWFLSTWTIMCVLDLLVTAMRENGLPDTNYIAFIVHFGVISAIGIGVKKRAYDLVAAWYIAIIMALWSFGVRGTLF